MSDSCSWIAHEIQCGQAGAQQTQYCRITSNQSSHLSEILFLPSAVSPLTFSLSFSFLRTSLSCRFFSSCSSKEANPNSKAFAILLFNIASLVFSAILNLVSSECFFPTFHGTFPLFAADIFALDSSEWGCPPLAVSTIVTSSIASIFPLSIIWLVSALSSASITPTATSEPTRT